MARLPTRYHSGGLTLFSDETEGYLEKLGKYVPVEGIAPAIALTEMVPDDNDAALWASLFAAFFVGTVIQLVSYANTPADKRPGWWYWLLMPVAFYVWAAGSSADFRDILNLQEWGGKFLLAIGAFVLPFIDMLFELIANSLAKKRMKRSASTS